MHALALLALCATGWAFPALNPLLERKQRLERDLEGGVKQRSTFDTIYESNKDVVQHPGKYCVTDPDIARPTSRSVGMCTQGICTWPKNPDGKVYIPYTQTKDFSSYDNIVFLIAFGEFASATCIRFVQRSNETDYITFESGSGCWSPIGRIGNQQFVSIAKKDCMVIGAIAHQLMHSLGFNHEHVREDRDNYVAVQWGNILSGHENEFTIADTNNVKYTPYDYGSILHYGKKANSKDGISETLIPIPDSSVNIGQTFSMSDTDIQKINLLYQCDQYLENPKQSLASSQTTTSATTTITATMATTPPRVTNISTALATSTTAKDITALRKIITSTPTTNATTTTAATTTPTTLAATTTVSKDGACGGTLTAHSGQITTPYYPYQYPRSTVCVWTITATTLVNITFVDFHLEDGMNCMFDYMKFDDLSAVPVYMPNSKYCGDVAPNTWVSFGGSVQIIFSSDTTVQMTGFKLRYTAE